MLRSGDGLLNSLRKHRGLRMGGLQNRRKYKDKGGSGGDTNNGFRYHTNHTLTCNATAMSKISPLCAFLVYRCPFGITL